MADIVCDLTNGNDGGDGLSWGARKLTMQASLTAAGAGGRAFVQIDTDDVATTKDTAASARTLTWPGTDQNPCVLYGVKNGTTAYPPTDSDLVVRETDSLPVFEATSGGNDITLDEASAGTAPQLTAHGIRFDSADRIIFGQAITGLFSDCEFDFDQFQPNTRSSIKLLNCDLIFQLSNSDLIVQSGIEMIGGVISGTAPSPFISISNTGNISFYGVDLSLIAGTLMTFSAVSDGVVKIVNCKMATGVTRITGTPSTAFPYIELIGSSDETGLGSGESVRDYVKEWFKGTILSEATFVRTGGVSDGVASWSYALTPRASSTKESLLSIETPWFGGIIEGDAATSKDFTIYIANSSGADLTEADVWVELLFPSEAGITQHDLDVSSRTVIDASASNVADDTASDWSTGAGGKNAQKIVIAKTPGYQGPVYARVHFAQAGTTTCYVDPKVYVTDT
jgi:hypothetical protein